MVEKIPFSSLKNPEQSEIEEKLMKCSYCDGILYEPVISTKNRLNYCKTCLLEQNNIDQENLSLNYSTLYKQAPKQIKAKLNSFQYTCPNFDFEENTDEKQYNYDELINHLIICDNNKIKCPSCGTEKFLKDIENNEKQKLIKILMKNKILEKELEYQKSIIVEMEKEKKQTIEINKNKEPVIRPKTREKTKIKIKKALSTNKINIVKHERINSRKLTAVKKNELPPIRRKSNIFIKRKEEPPKLNFKYNFKIKEKPKEVVLDNSRNNTLFDKCPHFYGNYMPKFACCGKFYGCYLCHNENENHPYQFSNKVACLFCKNVYPGKTCTKCKANQIFKRKKF